jgi:hypothetical protein
MAQPGQHVAGTGLRPGAAWPVSSVMPPLAACDFSDYSRLHTVVYQEIIAGRGHRVQDASAAVALAERVREEAVREPSAAL